MDVWVERELEGGDFPDERLKTRLGKVLADLSRRIGDALPVACQDWAATKAAYRFFSNGVNGARIVQRLAGSRRSVEKCSAHGLIRGFVRKTCDGKSVTSPTNREKHECTTKWTNGPKSVAWC